MGQVLGDLVSAGSLWKGHGSPYPGCRYAGESPAWGSRALGPLALPSGNWIWRVLRHFQESCPAALPGLTSMWCYGLPERARICPRKKRTSSDSPGIEPWHLISPPPQSRSFLPPARYSSPGEP